MNPSVSVIIPTFNRAAFLKETIMSALSQTMNDLDVWVVDDGSTDHTEDVIKLISDPRLHYLRISHSGLPSVPRNVGITNSRGRYVAFLDSDDLWEPNKLQEQLQLIQKSPEAGLYYSHAKNFDRHGIQSLTVQYKGPINGFVFKNLLITNFIPILTVVIPRQVLNKVGLFDERPDFKALEDYDLLLRISAKYPIYCCPQVLAFHRQHETNIWRYDFVTIRNLKKVLRKNLTLYPLSFIFKEYVVFRQNYLMFKLWLKSLLPV